MKHLGMSLAQRLLAVMLALVAATALATALAINLGLNKALAPLALERQLHAIELAASVLSAVGEAARVDVTAARVVAPVATVLAAHGAGAPLPEPAHGEVLLVYTALLGSRPEYLQMRLLGTDGREVVRVERSAAGEPVRAVAQAQLQDKGDRPYFRTGLRLPAGAVELSPIELNQEGGRIQEPYLPVLRAMTPAHDRQGRLLGIAVLNIDMRPVLARIRLAASADDSVYLVDAEGRFIVHPDRGREFGHELGRPGTLLDELPEAREALAAEDDSALEVRAPAGEVLALAAARVMIEGGPTLKLMSTRPSTRSRLAPIVRGATWPGALAAALVAAAIALLLARTVTRPLNAMTTAVRGFLDGGGQPMPIAGGEVGLLSQALQRMAATLKERDAARAREEARFREVVEAAPNAMLTIDAERRIGLVNRNAEVLFGRDRQSLIGTTIETLVPDRYRADHPALVAGYHRAPEARPMGAGRELFALRADGTEVPVEIGLNPIQTATGRLTLASIIDISERKQAEATRARLAAIVAASGDAIVSIDLEGRLTSWNRGAERMFGHSAAEAIGHPFLEIVRAADDEGSALLRQRLAEALRGEGVGVAYELVRLRRDGSPVDVSAVASALRGPDGRIEGTAIVYRDVTEQKKQADELRRSNAELEQFAYVASHDLQEPLRMVANYTELLAERYRGKLDERADKYIHYASDGARRMQRLVSDLLAYSRVGSQGKPLTVVDSAAVVERVLRTLRQKVLEAGGRVEVGPLPHVLADETQLVQLFQNLIGNALKFRGEAPPLVRVSAAPEGPRWRFEVADNGIGLDMAYAERIFMMFQRLHAIGQYEGSGIGLAIAKRIVERHGGHIGVSSQPGQGTTFHFTLAAAQGAP